jgi:radical SAM superfamily enzyme YgiQ (UPF0313 family)
MISPVGYSFLGLQFKERTMSMKILLVRPYYFSKLGNLEPLSLEYLGGVLKSLKIPYAYHDEYQFPVWNRHQRLINRVIKEDFDWVGFSANASGTDYVLSVCAALKQRKPSIKTIIGGVVAELDPTVLMKDPVDVIYYDNGLSSFKALCQHDQDQQAWASIPGISVREDGRWVSHKKSLPVSDFLVRPDREPFYKYLNRNFIIFKGSHALMKTSFSCPHDCSFCCCRILNDGVYTERSLDDVIDEIKSIDHQRIWFIDDSFTLNSQRVIDFCHRILDEKIDKRFACYSRADFVINHPDLLPLMFDAGIRDLSIGLESADDETLNDYHKHISSSDNETAIRLLNESGITCTGLFVISPKATRTSFRTLIRFIRRNNLLYVAFAVFTAYKGTQAYDDDKDKITRYDSKVLDNYHLTVEPEEMSAFEFMLRMWLLYALTYPRILVRYLFKTADQPLRRGWI